MFNKILKLKILGLTFGLACATGSKPANVSALLRDARAAELLGDHARARKLYARLVREAPDLPDAWRGLGRARAQAGDTWGAIRAFSEAFLAHLRSKEKDPLHWLKRGQAHLKLGQLRKAEGDTRKAVELAPNNPFAWNGLGVVLYKQGKYEEAEKAYKKALKLAPDDPRFWHNLGLLYRAMGRDSEAVSAYLASLHADQSRAQVWNDLGVSYKALGQLGKALECYDRALSLRPSAASFWRNKGLLMEALDKPEGAFYCFMKAGRLGLDPQAFLGAARSARKLGKLKTAKNLLDRLKFLRPWDPEVWAERVLLAFETEGLDGAEREFNAALRYLDEGEVAGALGEVQGNLLQHVRALFSNKIFR